MKNIFLITYQFKFQYGTIKTDEWKAMFYALKEFKFHNMVLLKHIMNLQYIKTNVLALNSTMVLLKLHTHWNIQTLHCSLNSNMVLLKLFVTKRFTVGIKHLNSTMALLKPMMKWIFRRI